MRRSKLLGLGLSIVLIGAVTPAMAKQEYRYDSLGRLVQVNNPNGVNSFYTYDDVGNRLYLARGTYTTPPTPSPAPWAADDNHLIPINTSQWVWVLGNDTGTGITVISVSNVSGGNAWVSSGGGSVAYAAPGYAGSQSFTYTIQDSQGRTASATVHVEVYDAGEPPCEPSGGQMCEADP